MDVLQDSRCESIQYLCIACRSLEENSSTIEITQKNPELTLSLSYLDSHQSEQMKSSTDSRPHLFKEYKK